MIGTGSAPPLRGPPIYHACSVPLFGLPSSTISPRSSWNSPCNMLGLPSHSSAGLQCGSRRTLCASHHRQRCGHRTGSPRARSSRAPPVPIGCQNPSLSLRIARYSSRGCRAPASPESRCVQAFRGICITWAICLPCRRSWVRIPSAAYKKACKSRASGLPQSASASVSSSELAPGHGEPVRGVSECQCLQGLCFTPHRRWSASHAEGRGFGSALIRSCR